MVIDFRVRPPYRGFLDMGIFARWASPERDPKKMSAFGLGREDVPSVERRSLDLFFKEMDEAGVEACVVMGRRTKNSATGSGNVEADDIHELAQRHPGRVIPFAGVDPTDEGALREVDRVARGLGFKGISLDPGWCVPALYADDDRIMPIYEACERLGHLQPGTCRRKPALSPAPRRGQILPRNRRVEITGRLTDEENPNSGDEPRFARLRKAFQHALKAPVFHTGQRQASATAGGSALSRTFGL